MGCHVSAAPDHQILRFTPLDSRLMWLPSGLLGYELDVTKLNAAQEKSIEPDCLLQRAPGPVPERPLFYCLNTPQADKGGAWMVVSQDRRQAAVLEMTGLVRPNRPCQSSG